MDRLSKIVFALCAAPFVLLALALVLPFIALSIAAILTGVFILPFLVFFVLVPLFVLHGVYERRGAGPNTAGRSEIRRYYVRWNGQG